MAKKLPDNLSNLNADDQALIALTQKLVQIPSVTPIDKKDLAANRASLDLIEEAVKETGATTQRLSFSGGHEKWDYEVDNLYIEWTIGSPDKHICYIGHTDVVPPGDKARWDNDPFSGKIKDGFIHGRGTTDMKGSVTAFTKAVTEILASADKDQLNMRIGILLTTDEEWAAVNGTKKVLDWMKANGKNPDAFIVGEPSSQDTLGSHIKIGRRGSLCGTFNIKGVQGHAAYTDLFENPNRALSLALTILNSQAWKDGNEYFPNTNFEAVATKSGDFNASAVIPGQADVLWNFRYTHKQTPEGLEKHVKDSLENPPEWAKDHPDFDKLKMISVKANIDTASLPYYSEPAGLAKAAQEACENITGSLSTIDGSGGTTDGRFVHGFFPSAEIIELGLPERGGIPCKHKHPEDYLKKGGMHQIDERCAIQDILQLRDIFKETLFRYNRSNDNHSQKPKKVCPKKTR